MARENEPIVHGHAGPVDQSKHVPGPAHVKNEPIVHGTNLAEASKAAAAKPAEAEEAKA
jgi:hypothetical protein